MSAGLFAVAGPAVGAPAELWSQQPLRAAVMGDPQVGHAAPDFTIPYLTAMGPGPADQPFHLRAELGRRVVLVFAAAPDGEAVRAVWERLAAQRDSVFFGETVVAGLFRVGAGPVQAFATTLSAPFKFLADADGEVFRRYGVASDPRAVQVFVVGDDGRLVHRARRFRPADERAWRDLARAFRP